MWQIIGTALGGSRKFSFAKHVQERVCTHMEKRGGGLGVMQSYELQIVRETMEGRGQSCDTKNFKKVSAGSNDIK